MLATRNIKERECYWIPHPSKVYKMVMIQHIEGDTCIATTTDDNTEIELDIPDCPFYPVNPCAVDDMTSLHYLHEAGILSNLEERSKLHNQIPYTYVSNVLIAVNPLRKVPEIPIEKYLGTPISAVPPHPYGIAEMAYRQMILPKLTNRDQSIVISGESGAGKTETAKIVLRYLCWRSTEANCGSSHTGPHSHHEKSKVEKGLDHSLLQSNPILEAFGNAKTQRNDNSSRFGKFLKLQFDPNHNFALVSAGIDTYLLEKSRVVSVSEGERNYHVFYELIGGATETLKKKLRLKALKNYRYLNMSSEVDIDGVNNKVNFATLKQAMTFVGMSATVEQDCIFRTLSAILSLGNAEFIDVTDENGSECAVIAENYLIARVAELLGVDKNTLELSLTTRYISIETSSGGRRHSNIRTPRNSAQATYSRDAMAKSIYQRVFDWIVKRISQSLNHQHSTSLPFIGVLDIFGFEDFTTNGLEQLLINYANEALQSIYSKEVLITEHDLFVEEGLQDIHVGDSFKFNDGCIDLIGTGSKSIISYLDSVCVRPGIEEEVFTSLLHTNLTDHPFFPSPKTIEKRDKFKIKHYARVVTYTVGSFISRNMDVRLPELEELLVSSHHNVKCGLFVDSQTSLTTATVSTMNTIESHSIDDDDVSTSVTTRESRVSSLPTLYDTSDDPHVVTTRDSRVSSLSRVDSMRLKLDENKTASGGNTSSTSTPTGGHRQKSKKQYTIGGFFIKRMTELTKTLLSTKCSFVRCIKPNPHMTPGKFDHQCVVDQLRCLGVIQTCEVLKAGMPTRIKMTELDAMYRPLLPMKLQSILQHISHDSDAFIRALMWAFQIPLDSYKIGKTRIFFRIGKISLLSELTAVDITSTRGEYIAQRLRRYVTRIWWRKAFIKMSCDYHFIELFHQSRRRRRSILKIQKIWKQYIFSEKKIQQKIIRRKWRLAYLFVRCQNIFLREYELIREATNMRLAAEAYAEETIRKMKEAEEKEEDERVSLIDSANAYATVATATGTAATATAGTATGVNATAPGVATGGDSQGIGGSDGSVVKRDEFTERGRSQSNAVPFNQAKMKSEMQALVAASSLATVSVCLFRWTKIKLFAAFETWLAILPPEVLEQQQRLKPLASRMSMGEEAEASPFDRQGSGEWSPAPSPIPPEDDTTGHDEEPSPLSPIPRKPQTSQPGKLDTLPSPARPPIDKGSLRKQHDPTALLQPKDSTSSLLSTQTNTRRVSIASGTAGAAAGGGVPLMQLQFQEMPITDGKCYECEQRDGVLWCPDCGQDYCKVCSQFVHECCKVMKTHLPVPMDQKKYTPIRRLVPMEGGIGGQTINSIPFEYGVPTAGGAGAGGGGGRRRTHSDSVLREDSVISSFHEDDSLFESPRDKVSLHSNPKPIPSTGGGDSNLIGRQRRRMSYQTRKVPSNAESMPFSMSMARGGDDHSHKDPCAIKSCTREACKGISIRFCEEHYEEFRSSMKGGGGGGGGGAGGTGGDTENDTKTLQQQVALLKRQLQESGQQPVEFVELSVARERMQQAVQRLMGGEEAAEKDIERWDKAIRMNPEYQKEMEQKAKQWEIDQQPINYQCLMRMRSLIPPNVGATSVSQMLADGLPKTIANRIWTKKSLWIINTHPEDTKRVHIADLNTKYGNQGLDIVEMRAIWANLPEEFENDGDGKKGQWRTLFRQKLEELTVKEASNRLSTMEKRNPAYKGFDNLSIYDPTVEITRAEIQKSTAFDMTEKPEVGSSLGDGIKELKKQMAAAEKPMMDGMLTQLQGSGDADGGKKVWVTILLQKKTINIFPSQKAAETSTEGGAGAGGGGVPESEFVVQVGHSIRSGPGKATFCVMSGEIELLVFQSEKSKRDKWVEALNEIVKLVNTVPKIQKKVAPPAPVPTAAAEETAPERPKPSFLAGIANKRKDTGGGGGGGEDGGAPPEKPSFLSAIAAGKKKTPGGGGGPGGDEKPSFLAGIAARKKAGGGEDGAAAGGGGGGGGGGNPLLAGIAARRKDLEEEGAAGVSPAPSPVTVGLKKKKETRTEDI